MARRQATEEQKAAAKERREKMRELSRKVAALSPEARTKLSAESNIVTIEGRALSPHNQCMLIYQIASPTVVGGFQQWKKAGRVPAKGSHGLAIWIPTGITKDNTTSTDEGNDGSLNFILGTVFDITQTVELTSLIQSPCGAQGDTQ